MLYVCIFLPPGAIGDFKKTNEFSGLGACLATMIIVSGTATLSCAEAPEKAEEPAFRHHVIFDTDADNEIDDQHALA